MAFGLFFWIRGGKMSKLKKVTKETMANVIYFKPAEFDDPNHPGSWEYMSDQSVRLIDRLREHTNAKIVTHNKFGLTGCVCVEKEGHSANSRHYITNSQGVSAIDFHFESDIPTRLLTMQVLRSGFNGIGIYENCWKWNYSVLPVAFHVDLREKHQVWLQRKTDEKIYLMK
jgi:hypothetical protein